MDKLDKFLDFFIENLEDPRIIISKKMKYGHRFYYINFIVDEDPTNTNTSIYQYRENLEVIFDNRNGCIEIFGGDENNSLIVEDRELLDKWSEKLEELLSKNLEDRVAKVFEKTLSDCYNKNLYRELQMKKIFKEDESI